MMRKCIAFFCVLLLLCTTSCAISETPDGIMNVTETHSEWYYYTQLTANEKRIYLEIMKQAERYKTEHVFEPILIQFYELDINDDYLSQEEMWRVEMAFSMDHPECFWAATFQDIRRDGSLTTIDYGTCMNTDVSYARVWQEADIIIKKIPAGASDYEKVQHIYEQILKIGTYNPEAPCGQDIRGILLGGQGVCASYANTFKFVCDIAGIPCISVQGYSQGSSGDVLHMWNAVQIDSQWYWIDATWGDTTPDSTKYLCTSDEVIKKTHKLCHKACDPRLESPYTFVLPTCPNILK